jgi:hypothetical protein
MPTHKQWQALQKHRLLKSQQNNIQEQESKKLNNSPDLEIWKAKRNLRYYLRSFKQCLK